ncbi:MAG: hypothetical protein ACAH83_20570 [Alphaproteobacteria bacterium]
MTVFLAAQEKMEMFFNGPMRSGIVLDSQGLLNRGYRTFQKELAETLRQLYVGEWEYPDFQGRKNKLAFDVDSFQGETIIPRYLISRFFEGRDLEEILTEFHLPVDIYPAEPGEEDAGAPQPDEMIEEPEPTEEEREPTRFVTQEKRTMYRPGRKKASAVFRIEKLDIFLYDYGYASCIISGYVTANKDLTIQEYRSAVEHISSAMPDYTELFQSTIAKVAKAIPPEFVVVSYHDKQPEDSALWPNTTLKKHMGELFWVHRIFSVPCRAQVDFIRAKTECRALVYSARTDVMDDISLRPDMAVFPGHGNSCVVYTKDATPEWNRARLRSVVRAKNVFYAALEDVDRDLFYLNNEIGARGHSDDMAYLERQVEYMSDCLSRVNFLKSIYDDYDNQLDPQSIEIWNVLRKVWIMDDMFRAIDQKVTMLDKAHARTVQRLAALQSKKIGALIIIFIMVALFAVIFGLLGVFSGGRTAGLGIPETILLAFALIGATLLAMRLYKGK